MKNKDEIKKIFDDITEKTNAMEAIQTLANTTYEMGVEACSKRKQMTIRIDKLAKEMSDVKKIICGNGNPTSSMLSRLDRMELATSSIEADVKEIKDAIVGNLSGGETSSLKSRISDCEKVTRNVVKITWAVGLLLIGEFIALVIGLL